jgi:hypothetical protein
VKRLHDFQDHFDPAGEQDFLPILSPAQAAVHAADHRAELREKIALVIGVRKPKDGHAATRSWSGVRLGDQACSFLSS